LHFPTQSIEALVNILDSAKTQRRSIWIWIQ